MNEKMGKLVEAIVCNVPYPYHITEWDITEGDVRFTWRGDRFKVNDDGEVESVVGGFLQGDNISILMRSIVKSGLIKVWGKEKEAKNGKGKG